MIKRNKWKSVVVIGLLLLLLKLFFYLFPMNCVDITCGLHSKNNMEILATKHNKKNMEILATKQLNFPSIYQDIGSKSSHIGTTYAQEVTIKFKFKFKFSLTQYVLFSAHLQYIYGEDLSFIQL